MRSTPIVYAPELYVLKHTKAPAVLIENGFHTNQDEVSLLKEAAYRQKLAVAEARGILEYLGSHGRRMRRIRAMRPRCRPPWPG